MEDAPRPARAAPSPDGVWAALAAALGAFAALACTVVWLTTGGGFWPVWVWLGLAVAGAVAAWAHRARRGEESALALHGALVGIVVLACVGVWLAAGGGALWPGWVLFGLGIPLGVHALVARRDALPRSRRERALTERVGTLEETRRGALDVQAAELRRIERDLHDGAQARLVALTMRLGRAEARLDDNPEAAALVRAARDDATAAIGELRDLARGIAPPVLADRGLGAAAQALGERAPLPVAVRGELRRRPAPVVESAAYFVIAETLTNAAKHAPGARATVTLAEAAGVLRIVVADDGPGGAVATGSGLSGLQRRVAALDGTFALASPAGRGTRVEVALPCGW